MKTTQICIKTIAVLIAIGAVTAAYGKDLLSAFAENGTRDKRILVNGLTRENSANDEIRSTVIGKAQKSIKQGKDGEMPFLVKGIKYNCIERNEQLLFYNSNQKMIYSIPADMCIYFAYSCKIGSPKLSDDDCMEIARKGVYSAFSNYCTPRITECNKISSDEKVCSFCIRTDFSEEAAIKISVRKDTGSIILYDALSCESAVTERICELF